MKYGLLMATALTSVADRKFINIGDMLQSKAILYMYQQMGIPSESVIRIELMDLVNGNTPKAIEHDYVILPININLSLNWIVNIFPLSMHIIPVFLGLSYFAAEVFPPNLISYFRLYAPIGCRDESTLKLMHENGIPAYLFGCITQILPRQKETRGNKVFFVDVPDSFEQFSRTAFARYDEVERLSHILSFTSDYTCKDFEKIGADYYRKYFTEASLVITSRLHCMSPCMAMGIPVIPVTDNISPRMGWIDRYLRIYTPNTYHEITWDGQTVYYEDKKRMLLDIAIQRVQDTMRKYGQVLDCSYYFETRTRAKYGNYYKEILKRLPKKQKINLKYILWGSGQIGMNVHNIIQEVYPNSILTGVVDSYCEGSFFGVPIEKPDMLEKRAEDAFVFITTKSGEQFARRYLESLGMREEYDFLSMATSAG